MNIVPIFCNFYASDNLDIDNQALKDYCYKLKDSSQGRIISNAGGWQSNDLDLKSPELTCLFTLIYDKINSINQALGFKQSFKQIISNAWININSPGSYNMSHIHPMSLFSGTYYVHIKENAGNFKFTTPNPVLQYVVSDDMIDNFTEYVSASYDISPSTGGLVVFPSWMPHRVMQNQSDEDRISISFNTIAVY